LKFTEGGGRRRIKEEEKKKKDEIEERKRRQRRLGERIIRRKRKNGVGGLIFGSGANISRLDAFLTSKPLLFGEGKRLPFVSIYFCG
jgi:hypothetical protein